MGGISLNFPSDLAERTLKNCDRLYYGHLDKNKSVNVLTKTLILDILSSKTNSFDNK